MIGSFARNPERLESIYRIYTEESREIWKQSGERVSRIFSTPLGCHQSRSSTIKRASLWSRFNRETSSGPGSKIAESPKAARNINPPPIGWVSLSLSFSKGFRIDRRGRANRRFLRLIRIAFAPLIRRSGEVNFVRVRFDRSPNSQRWLSGIRWKPRWKKEGEKSRSWFASLATVDQIRGGIDITNILSVRYLPFLGYLIILFSQWKLYASYSHVSV